MLKQLASVEILVLPSLPSASDYAGSFVRVGSTLYFSDGSAWHQVAPIADGSVTTPKLSDGAVTLPKLNSSLLSSASTRTLQSGDYIPVQAPSGGLYRALAGQAGGIPFLGSQRELTVGLDNALTTSGQIVISPDGASIGKWLLLGTLSISGNYAGGWFEWSIGRAADTVAFPITIATYIAATSAGQLIRASGQSSSPRVGFIPSIVRGGTLPFDDVALVETATNTVSVYVRVVPNYISPLVWQFRTQRYNITISLERGTKSVVDTLPSPVSGGLSLQWSTATRDQLIAPYGWFVGSGANGEYIRFPDGTQICWHTATPSSGVLTWTFPAAFAAAPVVQATPQGGNTPHAISIDAPSTTAATVRVWSWTGSTFAAANPTVHLLAIGRWK